MNLHCIISFDIGRKNLGFTIIKYVLSDNKSKFNYSDLTIKFDLLNIESLNQIKSNLKSKESCFISKSCFKSNSSMTDRCIVIYNLMKDLNHCELKDCVIDCIIIEKQVVQSTINMSLMHSIISISLNYTNNIYLFNPIDKFTLPKIKYSTLNKAHKKLIVNMACNLLKYIDSLDNSLSDSLLTYFNSFNKKDDIADSLIQAFCFLIEENLLDDTFDNFRSIV